MPDRKALSRDLYRLVAPGRDHVVALAHHALRSPQGEEGHLDRSFLVRPVMLEVYACRRPVILAASRQAGGIPEGSAILLDCVRREDRHSALAPGLQRRAHIIIGSSEERRVGKEFFSTFRSRLSPFL